MNVRIRVDMPFGAGVYYIDQYRVNYYNLRLWVTTNHSDPAMQNIALERVKHFVYQELDSSVFISADHVDQCQQFVNAGMKLTTMPCEPVDQIVGIMLYYKLNAIMEEFMVVNETELSSTMGDSIVYLHNDNEEFDNINYPDWWFNADPSHCDLAMLDQEKVLSIPQYNAWRDLGLAWLHDTAEDESGNVVVFADFKNNETK